MKKVLLISDVNFWERSSGHRARIYQLVSYLAARVKLTVVNTGPVSAAAESVPELFPIEFVVLEPNKYLSSAGYGRKLGAFLKGRQFDVVIVEYIHSSYFLHCLQDGTTVILDAHDIISDRGAEFEKFRLKDTFTLSLKEELSIMDVYDYVMVLCEPDREKLQPWLGQRKLLLCPHPVKLSPRTLKKEVKNIVFVASAYLPNTDAITFFLENCWPTLIAKYDVRLVIYGTVCEGLDFSHVPGVVLKGFVEDAAIIYQSADIIINPIRFGAGLKIKNIEALANGIPLVTTSHGARGLMAPAGDAFLVADDEDEFAAAICRLVDSFELRQELAAKALAFIEINFSESSCFSPLLHAIN